MARDKFFVICNVGSGEATELTPATGRAGWRTSKGGGGKGALFRWQRGVSQQAGESTETLD